MDLTLVVAWIALVIALGSLCAVVVLLFQRTQDPDVEELAGQVVSLRKSHRAEQMRRVRETPPQAQGALVEDAPPGFQNVGPLAQMSKDELRKRALNTEPPSPRRH